MFKRAMKSAGWLVLLGTLLDVVLAPIHFFTQHTWEIRLVDLVTYWWQNGHTWGSLGIILVTAVTCWFVLVLIIWAFLALNQWLRQWDHF